MRIPFNRPPWSPRCREHLLRAVESPHHSGDGPCTKACHRELSKHLGGRPTLLTTSCTHALEMAALLLDIQPGDEVIVPSFTFVSTANAFALRGARLVFADIRPDTLNLDERSLDRLITPRTRAIVPVHYAGVACEMDSISRVADRHGIGVVEDNAHGLFGRYHGRPLGSFGHLATQSFHETKNISCGEGGALVINDERLMDRAEIIREKGTDRSRFFRGQVDKYSWVDLGSSYLPAEFNAAVLLGNLEDFQSIQDRRHHVWTRYDNELRPWARGMGVCTPVVPTHCEHPAHMYYLIMPSLDQRTAFIGHLDSVGIGACFHYLPLHLSTFGRRYGGTAGDCPVAESISDRLVRLPLHASMSDDDIDRVVKACFDFNESMRLVNNTRETRSRAA